MYKTHTAEQISLLFGNLRFAERKMARKWHSRPCFISCTVT